MGSSLYLQDVRMSTQPRIWDFTVKGIGYTTDPCLTWPASLTVIYDRPKQMDAVTWVEHAITVCTELGMEDLLNANLGDCKACPFCGWQPDLRDPEGLIVPIYPVSRHHMLWKFRCNGCAASMFGHTPLETFINWQQRTLQ